MDTNTRNHLTTRAIEELREILESGDRTYLLSLSRPELVATLERELYFLGLYRGEDTEARAFISDLIDQNIANWQAALAAFETPLAHSH